MGAITAGTLFSGAATKTSSFLAWHRRLQAKYTWGAPPGGNYRQGVSFALRKELGILEKGPILHHWLIPEGQWGRYVQNYVKNLSWNVVEIENQTAHLLIDAAITRSPGSVAPYHILKRIWLVTPTKAKFVGSAISSCGAIELDNLINKDQ